MTIATGVNKKLAIAKQTALATYGSPTGAKYLRRVTSNVDFKKATYQSNEIRPSQQVSDFRHGVVSVDGSINGELSVGGYQNFMESICRQAAQTAVTATAAAGDYDAVAGTGPAGTIVCTAGNFVTSGFRPGMVIRAGTGSNGFTTSGNNSTNLLITGIASNGKTLNVLRLDGGTWATSSETTNTVTLTSTGKHTYVPQTGQTRDYYLIEHIYSDIAQSELYRDCVISEMGITLPASGLATANFNIMGLSMATSTSAQISSPAAASTGAILAAANGALVLNGTAIALVTGMNFSVKGGYSTIGGVVGSNSEPDVFPGTVTVDGQATVLFQDATVRDMFVNETEVALMAVFTSGSTGTSDFISFSFPRVKFGGAGKDDGNKGLVMTMPFTALENKTNDYTGFQTTIMIQDSLWA
jgi:hypothetical protein